MSVESQLERLHSPPLSPFVDSVGGEKIDLLLHTYYYA